VQFSEPIANFRRVVDKIAMMAAEIMIARQLTYYAARQKDAGGADLKPAWLTYLRCSLPQPNPGAAAVFIDKLDTGCLKCPTYRQVVCRGHRGLALGTLRSLNRS
jgi:alkylation response protein AidB-like acyl-CoA dehydrogenase